MSMGFSGILVLALMGGGFNSADLVSLVQPTHYFKTREIDISIDKAMDYAGEEPKDGKAQIVQLTALRYLADEAIALKKAPNYAAHRTTLQQIAAGKKGADPQGFAQDYAQRVLVKLGEAKAAAVKAAPLRKDALNWFPEAATFAGAVDLQQVGQPGLAADPLKDILKMMPDREKKEMYHYLEKSGNIRLERVAFAMVSGTGKRGDQKIYVRFTGKGNHDWILDSFKMLDRSGTEIKQFKDEKEVPMALAQPRFSPMILLVGNTDIIVTGFDNSGPNDKDLVDEVLAVRAKKKPNAATGALKPRLAKIPDKAVAFLVGEVPDELKREFGRTFNPMPTNITAFVERIKEGLDVQAETSMNNGDDADKLVQKIAELRKEGTRELVREMGRPQRPGQPKIPFQSMINVMESLQVQSKAEKVMVRVVVPNGLIQEMTNGWMMFGGRGFDQPPNAEPKKDDK